MNFAVVGYLPPKSVGNVEAFLENMKRFPTKHPLILYSHYWKEVPCKAQIVPMVADVDYLRAKYPKVKMAVNNAVFYTGVRIAAAQKLTHFLCIEPDCRVNCPEWDDIIWQEFLNRNPEAICGGSIVAFNPCSWGRPAAERFERFLLETKDIRPVPMTVAGGGHTAERHKPCVFPNGAFAIYRMNWLIDAFPEVVKGCSVEIMTQQGPQPGLSIKSATWDAEIGFRMWDQLEHKVYDQVCPLGTIYSGYGDVMTSEADRRALLESGRIVGVHQVKSAWTGPEAEPSFGIKFTGGLKNFAGLIKARRVQWPLDAGGGSATARSPIPDARPTSVGGNAVVPASSESEETEGERLNKLTVEDFKEIMRVDPPPKSTVATLDALANPSPEFMQQCRDAAFAAMPQPKTDIFIVTFARDFAYLRYCLRSITKFTTGFSDIKILVPKQDVRELANVIRGVQAIRGDGDPGCDITLMGGDEWPNKGMLWHEAQIMRADEWCPEADYVLHMDSDCIFTAPVTPSTFFKNGKPVLRYEEFESAAKREPGVMKWKECTEKCLPYSRLFETMRGHPHVYDRKTYKVARDIVETTVKMPIDDYIRAQRNEHPQTFAEHITLGNVALQEQSRYSRCLLHGDENRWPVQQFWGHSPPDVKQTTWVNGEKKEIVPAHLAEEILDTE